MYLNLKKLSESDFPFYLKKKKDFPREIEQLEQESQMGFFSICVDQVVVPKLSDVYLLL